MNNNFIIKIGCFLSNLSKILIILLFLNCNNSFEYHVLNQNKNSIIFKNSVTSRIDCSSKVFSKPLCMVYFTLLIIVLLFYENVNYLDSNFYVPSIPKKDIKSNYFDNIYLPEYINNFDRAIFRNNILYCPISGNEEKIIGNNLKINSTNDNLLYKIKPKEIDKLILDNNIKKLVLIQDPLERVLKYIFSINKTEYSIDNTEELIKVWMNNVYPLEKSGINNLNKNLLPQFLFCDIYKWINEYEVYQLNNIKDVKAFINYFEKDEKIANHIYSNNENKIVEFLNVRHMSILLNFYGYDYKLFNLSLPEWICQVVKREWEQKFDFDLNNTRNHEPVKSEKYQLANRFLIDLLNLWYNLKNINNELSCMEDIEGCVFHGDCIRNNFNKNKIGKANPKANPIDAIYISKLAEYKPKLPHTYGYYSQERKKILCSVPKNAITMWASVWLRILNLNKHSIRWWSNDLEAPRLMLKQKLQIGLNILTPNNITSIMNNPDWYKAIFIRDPLGRILSGVKDKMEKRLKNIDNAKTLIQYWFKIYFFKFRIKNNIDQHVLPQYLFCDIYKWKDKFNIYSFDKIEDRKQFLLDIGLWEDIGKDGWHPEQHKNTKENEFKKFSNGTEYSLLNFTSPQFSNHATNSKQYLLSYFNVRHLPILIQFYGLDYKIFDLKFPEWICSIIDKEWIKLSNNNTLLSNGFLIDLLYLYNALDNFESHQLPSCFNKIKRCLFLGDCN